MKHAVTVFTILVVLMTSLSPALAVDTTRTYQSGILVLIFVGIFALIVVAQMVPALILMFGAISSFAKKFSRKKAVATVSSRNIQE